MRIDNAKCAITKACSHDPEVQRSYAELAEGYGFTIDPCAPSDPKKKGRVESGVKYIKRSFLALRRFRDRVDANAQLIEWVMGPAGNRIHGTTHERPLTRFAESERALLQALPDVAPEPATWRQVKVCRDAHVCFEKVRYSVPYALMETSLWLRATPSTVSVFKDSLQVAIHVRLYRPGEHSTLDDHLPPEALAFKRQDVPWCHERSKQIGPFCAELIEELLGRNRILDRLRAAQSVLRLAESYGSSRLEAACQRALAFGDTRYRSVRTILEKGLDQLDDPDAAAPFQLAPSYTGAGRFTRDLPTLLTPQEVAR